MKKTKANPRRTPKRKAVKNPQSPWYKYRTVPPKSTAPASLPCDEPELILGGGPDGLADEIERLEQDPDAEPEEITEE
jgi:hypothetical protein